VVIVDYLPLGQRRELDPFFASCNSLKYFLHRGLSDTSDGHILRGSASKEIAQVYDRILVASDPRLVDVATEDDYCQEARAKLSYVGFIGSPITLSRNNWSPTVVCSGGGGFRAEDLMLACIKTAESNPQIPFKIVLGPRSRLSASCLSVPPNCEAWQTRADLPELHRTAAIVISTGGYNSVLEAASGGARLIIYPNQVGQDDEQLRFAVRLSKYYPVRRLDNLDALPDALRTIWPESIEQCTDTFPLQMGGAERIGELLSIDLKARAALSPINRQSPCGGI
jgi:predicted glycosyltransferase